MRHRDRYPASPPFCFYCLTTKKVCLDRGSNTGPLDLQSNALPTELSKRLHTHRLRAGPSDFILPCNQWTPHQVYRPQSGKISWPVNDLADETHDDSSRVYVKLSGSNQRHNNIFSSGWAPIPKLRFVSPCSFCVLLVPLVLHSRATTVV